MLLIPNIYKNVHQEQAKKPKDIFLLDNNNDIIKEIIFLCMQWLCFVTSISFD